VNIRNLKGGGSPRGVSWSEKSERRIKEILAKRIRIRRYEGKGLSEKGIAQVKGGLAYEEWGNFKRFLEKNFGERQATEHIRTRGSHLEIRGGGKSRILSPDATFPSTFKKTRDWDRKKRVNCLWPPGLTKPREGRV